MSAPFKTEITLLAIVPSRADRADGIALVEIRLVNDARILSRREIDQLLAIEAEGQRISRVQNVAATG